MIGGVQTVFLVAAPIAALALAIVLALSEAPLRGAEHEPRHGGQGNRGDARPVSRVAAAVGQSPHE